jgi:hypothetical protein
MQCWNNHIYIWVTLLTDIEIKVGNLKVQKLQLL